MEWLESGRIRADDVYLQLLGKESCLGALEDKSLRSNEEPTGGSSVVFSGSLRSPDDPDALSVELSLGSLEVSMHADGEQLGSWPVAAVGIRRFNTTAFEFTAEGDRLFFTPDDPTAFGDSLIAVPDDEDTGDRKRRKPRKRSDKAEPRPAREVDSSEEEPSVQARAEQESPEDRPRIRLRRRRRSTAEPVGVDAGASAPPGDSGSIDATADDRQPATEAPSSDRRRKGRSPEPENVAPGETRTRTNRAWIRALDLARKYDTFGLDRVPIDTRLRGQDHQHTWDHRVAATSGLGKHICTICGAIRR